MWGADSDAVARVTVVACYYASVSPRTTSTFDVIPAIDLRGGAVVRLEQGDFGRETTFSDDPVEQARTFVGRGARWIHVVDLDGARDGSRPQATIVARIVHAATPAAVEVAGGLRDAASIEAALEAGAARVVIGTAAITDPDLVSDAVRRHGPDPIAVAVDVRDGQAVGSGWLGGAPARDIDGLLADLERREITTVIVTAIERDGLLGGPDLALLAAVAARPFRVIASGGLTTLADLRAVRAIGCVGAIVGRAIYDGQLDLAAAIAAMDQPGG